MISPPYHTRPTTPTNSIPMINSTTSTTNSTITNNNTNQLDLNSMMSFMFIHPPMPPPLSEDACCPPQPDASLLFGTPAPTRVHTAAPTVNSSPSKLNSINFVNNYSTNYFDPRTTSVITQAMAALQFSSSSTYHSSSNNSSDITTMNLYQQQQQQQQQQSSNFDHNFIDSSHLDNNKSTITTTISSSSPWAPAVIRLKAPTVPITDSITIIPTSSNSDTTTTTTTHSDMNSTLPIISTSEPPRTSSPCR